MLQDRSVALVGGAGFIGHHLAAYLKKQGAQVTVLDGFDVNNLDTLERDHDDASRRDRYRRFLEERLQLLTDCGVPAVHVDAKDPVALGAALEGTQADTIVHLAAVSHAGRAEQDPRFAFDNSLVTLQSSLDVARNQLVSARRFVYLSSSLVYGSFGGRTVTEEDPCLPTNIYGAYKLAAEKMVMGCCPAFDLDYTIVRPSALYGERCISRRVVQVFIENALLGQELSVRGDGSESLDFTNVADLVEGLAMCLYKDAAKNQIFNLTFGRARRVQELVELLRAHFPDLVLRHVERDSIYPDRGTLAVDKARQLLGFDPKVPLELGLERYVSWYKQAESQS